MPNRDLQQTVETLRRGDLAKLSNEQVGDLIATLLDAKDVVGPEQRDYILQHAARTWSMGDYVPGGGF